VNAPAILSPRESWLAARRELVTASDAGAILGVDPRRGPLAVYAEKVGGLEVEDSAPMKWGRRLEDAIAEGYAEETGRPVEAPPLFEITRHPSIPWLGATLDRRTQGSEKSPAPVPESGQAPLQLKAVSEWKRKEWDEEPPLGYQIQVQIEMACAQARWGSLCAFVGITQPPAWSDLLPNEAFLNRAIPLLEQFRLCVLRGTPPEADGLEGTSEAIRELWSDGNGETVPLDDEALALVKKWEGAKDSGKKAEDLKKETENKLRLRIGAASFGRLPDGSVLTLKKTKRAGYVTEPTEYRVLRRWWPKLLRRR
jgi:putative phage-type endonuclease